MCIICKKYGISETSYKEMIRNGVISTTFPAHEEIFVFYKQCLQKTGSSNEAVEMTSEEKGVSRATVYNVIAQFR